jgi:hypothetical protein
MEREKLPIDQMPDFDDTRFTYKGRVYTARLGRIDSTRFEMERGCFLTLWLMIDFGGTFQGFGGHVLHCETEAGYRSSPTHAAGAYVAGVFAALGVESYAELKGRKVWALKSENAGWHASIEGIVAPKCDTKECLPFLVAEWKAKFYPEKDGSNDN